MSYQVLARKWRPHTFPALIGQDHVVQPLRNALAAGRLHHALLFSGTRGVGKTTLARLYAKALNCERGVSAEPCGECPACSAIDAGRFVDLIEIDAASRTKVEDTRELLDNVQYAPTRGRYKVYLIDEVHMLSRHSFNALLKTLEEPPPHVVFLLATTDPQRLPVTVLSRCLQFNLKRLPVAVIAGQLRTILEREGIESEPVALQQLARAGDGSMRDALTLLDQAIASGAGRVTADTVTAMLGGIDSRQVLQLLQVLAARDAAALLACVKTLDEQAPDYQTLLGDLLGGLQRIAVLQAVPDAEPDMAFADPDELRELARHLSPEDVQLYYQIGLLGRRDLPLVPEPRAGFEMILLRMLCFTPDSATAAPAQVESGRRSPAAGVVAPARSAPEPVPAPPAARPEPPSATAPVASAPAPAASAAPVSAAAASVVPLQEAGQPASPADALLADWPALVQSMGLVGITAQLARHCEVAGWQHRLLTLRLAEGHARLRTERVDTQLREALTRRLGEPLRVRFVVGEPECATPAQQDAARATERQQEAARLIEQDPNVQALQDTFQARVRPDSVRPQD